MPPVSADAATAAAETAGRTPGRKPLDVLYGGTFDPVHDGHVAVARHARDALQARVHLMPAADPPHKGPTQADAVQRAQMLQLAIAGEDGLCVDLRELERGGASYTIDTLRALRRQVGMDASWAILVGADSFASLPTWKDWRGLFELAHVVVADRPGGRARDAVPAELAQAVEARWTEAPDDLHAAASGRVLSLRQPTHPASASALRHRIAAGLPWRDWVAPAVADYIVRHGLYA